MTESEFSDWVAEIDQAMASLKDMAKIQRAYFTELIEVGFTRGEALMLTANFHKALLTGGDKTEGGEED